MSRHTHHNCAVSSCGYIVPSEMLMCKEHWSMVPKPMQEAVNKQWKKGGAAAYLAARAAAVKAVEAQLPRSPRREEGDSPSPVAHAPASPVAPDVRRGVPTKLLALLTLCLLTQSCAVIGYKYTPSVRACACAGTNNVAPTLVGGTKFIALTCLSDDKIAKLAVNHTTKATATGLAIGAIEHAIDDDAIKAVVSGVVEGVIKGMKTP